MKSYYVSTHPLTGENHEVHEVGCNSLPIQRRYIGEFQDHLNALQQVRYTYADASICQHCDGSHYAIRYTVPPIDYFKERSA